MPPVSAKAFSATREELWKAASCHIKRFPKDAGVETFSQIPLYSFHQFSETVSKRFCPVSFLNHSEHHWFSVKLDISVYCMLS
jgi:hypothetical protein